MSVKKNSEFKTRLLEYLKYVGEGQTAFESRVGLSRGAINNLRDMFKKGLLDKISDANPDLNMKWLIDGMGTMVNEDIQPKLSTQKKEIIPLGKHAPLRLTADQYAEAFGDWEGLPMYNSPVTASFVETYRDERVYQPQYYLHDPRFKDCSFGAIITGDSMHSEIRHGDFVICQEIKDRRFLVYGDIYYVVGTNGLETCKYLNADPTNPGNLMLVARNEKISPSPIPKDMILKLFKVKGILRGY